MHKISVVVTNYNYGRYLEECLISIENQTFQDFELIVIDDASTDNSIDILKRHKRIDTLIQHDNNKGATTSKKTGVSLSTSPFVCCIDADDTIEPTYLEECLTALESDERIAIAYTYVHLFGNGKDDHICFTEFSLVGLQKGNFILGSSLFRKSAYEDAGGFDEHISGMEDYDLWLSICEKGYTAQVVQKYLYNYRSHDTNRTHEMNIDEKFVEIWDKHNQGKIPHVLAEVCTKDRYFSTLPMVLSAICMQTRLPDQLVIFDDSEKRIDLREVPIYQYLFKLMEDKKIPWSVEFGQKVGQVRNHERAQEMAKDLVWRVDDDLIPEPNVLEKLLSHMKRNDIGAVGGHIANLPEIPVCSIASGKIEDFLWSPNLQWFKYTDNVVRPVDHLHCSFLYRKGIAHYDMNLSPVGHLEETLFSYEIRHKGFTVLYDPSANSFHFRNPDGGIRSYRDNSLWKKDEKYGLSKLRTMGVKFSDLGFVYLDNGLGDHFLFKKLLPEFKAKHKKVVIACCYPEVFEDEKNITCISLHEAFSMVGDGLKYNLYKRAWDMGLTTSLLAAYRAIYGL